MKNKEIVIQGARAHNLKNIDVTIPRDQLVVMTGLSAPENPHLPLIPFMRKGSAVMLNRCLPMHDNF